MAIIPPYVAKTIHVGQQQVVRAKKFVWIPVGHGEVTHFSDFEVGVAGRIAVLGYEGDLNIYLHLQDEDPEADGGPCTLKLNTHVDENARYQTQRAALTVYANLSGNEQNITIRPSDGRTQTECRLFGKVNQTVHLEPKR